MMLPTTEVTFFATSELFRVQPDLLEPAFEQLVSKGVDVPLYSGLEVEVPNDGFMIANWDSYEHHQEVMNAPYFAELAKYLAPVVAGPPKVYHAQFSGPTVALDQPVTEIFILTLKTPENRAALVDIFSGIAEATNNLFVFGQTREDENKYLCICGRESVEAHKQARASRPESQEKMHSLADEDFIYHVKLKKYERM